MNTRTVCASACAALALLGLVACGPSSSIIPPVDNQPGDQDAGPTVDAAVDAPVIVVKDAGPTKDASTPDCGDEDSGTVHDSGSTPDSSTPKDSGTVPDSGTHEDGSTSCDAGPPPPMCHTTGEKACSATSDCVSGDTCTDNCCVPPPPPPTCQDTCQCDYTTCVDTCKSKNVCDLSLTQCEDECQCNLTTCLSKCADSGCTGH